MYNEFINIPVLNTITLKKLQQKSQFIPQLI